MSGGTFAIANAAQRALVFLMLPVYTAVLSPSAYGRLGLLITVQSGAVLLLQSGMEASVTRYYFRFEPDVSAQRRFVQSAWRYLVVAPPLLALVALVVLQVTTSASEIFRPDEASIALLSAAAFVAATVAPLTVLRAQQRLRGYLILTAVTGLTTTGLTLLFVVVFRMGVAGWFTAALIANTIIFITAVRVLPWERLDRFDRRGVQAALVLGLSLVPHALSLWALSLADRIVLATLISPSELGVYTLAANLAIPAMVVIQSLNQGFLPSYARAQNPEHAGPLRQVVALQTLMIVIVTLGVAVMAAPVIGLLDTAYLPALQVVPWLVLGAFFWGLYQLPMNVISMIAGRTQFVWMIGLTSATVGVGSLFLLVPDRGLSAAGPASAIGYLALLLFTLVYLRALRLGVPINLRGFGVSVALALGAYSVGTLLPQFGLAGFASRSGLVAVAAVAIAGAGGLRPHHVAGVLRRR